MRPGPVYEKSFEDKFFVKLSRFYLSGRDKTLGQSVVGRFLYGTAGRFLYSSGGVRGS